MRKIVISTQGSLLSSMLMKELKMRGTQAECIPNPPNERDTLNLCHSVKPDVLVLEVSYVAYFTYDDCMSIVEQVKKTVPSCKIALLCDENANPKIAEKVALAKKNGLIDNFFFTSVSGEYLTAALDAMMDSI